jgi:hypothetical protein
LVGLGVLPDPLTEAECHLLTGATAWYRDIRANMEQTQNPIGLDQCGEGRHRRRKSGPPSGPECRP